MTCAVSIKMMSSTRTTSTNGVTLISASGAAPPRRREEPKLPPPETDIAIALLSEIALGHIQKLQGEIVHARADFADFVSENIIENSRRNGCEQAHGSGHQSYGDARTDRAEAGGTLLAERQKGPDDAQNCA